MITLPQAPALAAILNAPAMIRPETPMSTIPGRRKAPKSTPVFGKAMGQDRTKTHNAICAAIRDYIRRQGGWCEKFSGGGFNPPGIPDLLACLPDGPRGVLIAIEVKTGSAVLNANQERMKAKLEASHALWLTAHSLEDVEARLVEAGLVLPCLL